MLLQSFMAFTQEFLDKVLAKLNPIGPIQTKKMFGGVGIYFEDTFFALIAEDILYFKVDDSNREKYISRSMKAFQPFHEKPSMNYYELPDEILNNDLELRKWVENSVEIAKKKRK